MKKKSSKIIGKKMDNNINFLFLLLFFKSPSFWLPIGSNFHALYKLSPVNCHAPTFLFFIFYSICSIQIFSRNKQLILKKDIHSKAYVSQKQPEQSITSFSHFRRIFPFNWNLNSNICNSDPFFLLSLRVIDLLVRSHESIRF